MKGVKNMVYVMSDIHGDMKKFRSVMSQIKITAEDHLYVLGDVIDRGSDGIEILRELMARPNVTVLLGNHEWMMLNALWGDQQFDDTRLWYRNGGIPTHDAYMKLPQKQQDEIQRFIQQRPLSKEVTVNGTKYILVHGAPPELIDTILSKYDTNPIFALWTRMRPDDTMPNGKTVIFGHTPTEYYQEGIPLQIWYGKDKIGIDCGSGNEHPVCRLACLRLDDMTEYYSN